MNIIEILKIVGGLAGIIALTWKVFEEFKVFLRIKVETQNENNKYTVLTEIENTSRFFNKKINNAFVIASKEDADLIEIGKKIGENLNVNAEINCTNDFEEFQSDRALYIDKEIAFIPLEFYYSENIGIGDEKLTYRCSIDNSNFESGNYSVRFFIYGNKKYHRSTQDLIIIEQH